MPGMTSPSSLIQTAFLWFGACTAVVPAVALDSVFKEESKVTWVDFWMLLEAVAESAMLAWTGTDRETIKVSKKNNCVKDFMMSMYKDLYEKDCTFCEKKHVLKR